MIAGSSSPKTRRSSKSAIEGGDWASVAKTLRHSMTFGAPLPAPYTLQHGEDIEHAEYDQHTEHRKTKIKL